MYLSFLLILSILTPRVISYISLSKTPTTSKIITQFPNPTWVENIAARSNGNLLVTLLSPGPYLYTITPPSQASNITSPATLLANLSSTQNSVLLGITETTPNTFYLIAGNYPSTNPDLPAFSIFSIDLTTNNETSEINANKIQKIADLPDAELLNGLATLSIERNLIIASDTFGGHIWLIDVLTGTTSILISDETMLAPNGSSESLGINGLRVLETEDEEKVFIYYSNSGAGIVCRVLFCLEGMEVIGEVEVLVRGIVNVDDFAIDEKRRVLWLAGGRENGVFRAPLSGGIPDWVIGGQNDTIVDGTTSCAVGRGRIEGRVFCTTDGTITGGGRVVEVIDSGN